MQVRKASRKQARLRLGICGPSGSGKTLSALLTAYGIVGDWEKIGLIDTEEGSGEVYVGQQLKGTDFVVGEYNYLRLEPPFTPQRYQQAMHAMEQALGEGGIVITDSLSHAWNGSGGVLEMKDRAAQKERNDYTAWRHVTPHHNALVDAILRSPCHMICTMRSKTDYVLETITDTNGKTKTVPRKIGLAPIQREGMDYEFTIMFDMDKDHFATCSKDRTSLFDGEYFRPSPATGEQMATWLNTGVAPDPTAPPQAEPDAGAAVETRGADQVEPTLLNAFIMWLRTNNVPVGRALMWARQNVAAVSRLDDLTNVQLNQVQEHFRETINSAAASNG